LDRFVDSLKRWPVFSTRDSYATRKMGESSGQRWTILWIINVHPVFYNKTSNLGKKRRKQSCTPNNSKGNTFIARYSRPPRDTIFASFILGAGSSMCIRYHDWLYHDAHRDDRTSESAFMCCYGKLVPRDRCSCRNSTIFSIYYNYSALKSWISEGWGTARDIFCYCAIRTPLNKKSSRERVAFSAKFAQQPLMIRVTNAKLRMMSNSAEKRKHGEMLSNSIRATICDPLICGKTNVFRSLLESIRFENVYLKSLQPSINISKIYVLQRCSIERGAFKFYFYLWWRGMRQAIVIREYFLIDRYADVDCIYLCQTYVRI